MKPEEPQSNTDTILPTDRRLLLGCKCTYCTSSDKLPLPDWWNLYPTEKASFLERCFLLAVRYNLCLVAYGRPDLDEVWFTVQPNHQEAWEKSNERIIQRLENQNIVGGLLLATVAVFITTEPPRPELVQYVKNLPYIFLLISFSLTIGSILSGSAIQACLPHVQVEWFCKMLFINRQRVVLTLWILSYPVFSMAAAGTCCALGVLLGAVRTRDRLLVTGSFFVLAFPLSLLFTFLIMSFRRPTGSNGGWYQKHCEALRKGRREFELPDRSKTLVDSTV